MLRNILPSHVARHFLEKDRDNEVRWGQTSQWRKGWYTPAHTDPEPSENSVTLMGGVRKTTMPTTWCLSIQHIWCYKIYTLFSLVSSPSFVRWI
jgi:hypothetical protein